ncbi:MAG: VCBS repeat-containing protein, partial [Treponema sp.]|nr:VCBS repeat-containing protein [Treponema sp.]
SPIYAIKIGDETKRQEIFDRAFRSIVIDENIQLNLDGMRIPRIQVPEFLVSLLQHWNIRVPSPFYYVHEGYLFVCESAETLQSCVRGIQRNEALPKTAVWQNLSKSYSDNSSFSLYYSLDRSLPFFLKGNTVMSALLGLYRQGLLRVGFENREIYINLSVIPGSGKGLVPVPGYPLDIEGVLGNRLYSIHYGKGSESRIFFTRDAYALALDPRENRIYEYDNQSPLWVIPAEGLGPKNPEEGSAWVVSAQGRVNLVNGNMNPLRGFPVPTGLRISAAPAAHGGILYLCDEDGRVYTINSRGEQNEWGTGFTAALRAPPSFLSPPKSNVTYAAVYPKSFLGEIWLLDGAGKVLPGWPVYITDLWADRDADRLVSGIAFGAPPVFIAPPVNAQAAAETNATGGRENAAGGRPPVVTAFITQAGELSIHDEGGGTLPGFPIVLEGVFFLQPVFDGEFLWLLSSEGVLYQVSLAAAVLQQKIPNLQVKEESCLIAADCDGDKIPEIFFSGEGNAFYGYARNFSSLDGFPLPVWGKPVIGDLNGDGRTEIVGAGLDNRIYRWQFR